MNKLYFTLCVLLLMCSCKKDEAIIIHDTSLTIDTVGTPAITVTMFHPEKTLNYQSGTLTFTIDVNSDSRPDFELINYYSTACLNADYARRSRIRALNAESTVLCDSSYKISTFKLGTGLDNVKTIDSLYPKINELRGKLELAGRYSNGNVFLTQSTASVCANPTAPVYTYDEAWNKKDKSFIGIRYDGRLGWIMIGFPNNMVIYGYGLLK